MVSNIGCNIGKFIDESCETVRGNSLKQTLYATAVATVATTAPYIAKPIFDSYPLLTTLAFSVNLICLALLAKNAIQWSNVTIYLLAVPIIGMFGIKWNPESPTPVYQAQKYEKIGSLEYVREANGSAQPVLTIKTDDPYDKGYAYGFLTAPQVRYIYESVFPPLIVFAQLRAGDVKGEWLDKKIDGYTIPEHYLTEMKGLKDGVNDWFEKNEDPWRLTSKQVLQIHCFTDTYKMGKEPFIGKKAFQYLWNVLFGDMGCSTMVIKRDEQMVVARNMDWPGLGMGELAITRVDLLQDGSQVRSHIYPGVISVATAIKIKDDDLKLAAIVNECSERSIGSGIPCGLWVRACIETCNTVDEVKQFVASQRKTASSFHLTVADGQNACNFQMHPRKDVYHLSRSLNDRGHLVVTNHFIDPATQQPIEGGLIPGTSGIRYHTVCKTIENNPHLPLEEVTAQALQGVNRSLTLSSHYYAFGPKKPGIQIVTANAWAAEKLS